MELKHVLNYKFIIVSVLNLKVTVVAEEDMLCVLGVVHKVI